MQDSSWNISKAEMIYNMPFWSDGYFAINGHGHLVMQLPNSDARPLDLYELVQHLQDQQVKLPVLVRFLDILHDRVYKMRHAFAKAQEEYRYQAGYTAIYPIKVNQQRNVVAQLLKLGDHIGLEAGSKPELMAVLALALPGSVIVCNGYKDQEYIRLALLGRAMGHQLYIVIEKASEVDFIVSEAKALGITPLLGVRVRLATLGAGKWQNTGGEKAKFGLSSQQLLHVFHKLKQAGLHECIEMLHFHMGSQIANIRDIQKGLAEAARFFVELHRLGAPLRVVDVGGGLGVDYDGSRSRNSCSINYQLTEYFGNVVRTFAEACTESDLPQPHIFTEAGRAMTAHHAVLITNVIDVEQAVLPVETLVSEANSLKNLQMLLKNPRALPPAEVYYEAGFWLNEAQSLYVHGLLTLEERAQAESLYKLLSLKVYQALQHAAGVEDILKELEQNLADKFFCNFSLFQSIPDVWGIDQIFPIVPLQRLHERPERRAIIGDLTCDSDGQIEQYVESYAPRSTLAVHDWHKGQDYYLGVFMVGAYQEILGDLHNLFGDTDAIDVVLDGQGFHLQGFEKGDSIEELLRYVHYDPEWLLAAYQQKINDSQQLHDEQRRQFMAWLKEGLQGYTYLEK
jgi:arginine decarboxylase